MIKVIFVENIVGTLHLNDELTDVQQLKPALVFCEKLIRVEHFDIHDAKHCVQSPNFLIVHVIDVFD